MKVYVDNEAEFDRLTCVLDAAQLYAEDTGDDGLMHEIQSIDIMMLDIEEEEF